MPTTSKRDATATRQRNHREMDELVRQYATSEWSDTFASYNSAIRLAREVRRLRRALRHACAIAEKMASGGNITAKEISAIPKLRRLA